MEEGIDRNIRTIEAVIKEHWGTLLAKLRIFLPFPSVMFDFFFIFNFFLLF